MPLRLSTVMARLLVWFFMLDLLAHGAAGHGPVHLLLTSAAEIGFAWDGGEQGWVRAALPPLRMLCGLVKHFESVILKAWQRNVSTQLAERQGFRGGQFLDLSGSLQLLESSYSRERVKMLLRSILCGGVWNGFLLGQAKKDDVPCQFCGKMEVVTCFGSAPSSLSCVWDLPEFAPFWPWIVVSGPGACFGMVGCLVSV